MPEGPAQTSLVLAFDRGTLVLAGSGGKTAVDAGGGTWTWDGRVSAWRCDAIHYPRIHRDLTDRFGRAFRDEVPNPARVFWPQVSLPELRPEQSEAVAAWTNAGCRGQIIMPTGTGKTEVALAAMAQTGTATLVVAPIRDLMSTTSGL
jgi:hypothetical protein